MKAFLRDIRHGISRSWGQLNLPPAAKSEARKDHEGLPVQDAGIDLITVVMVRVAPLLMGL